MEHTKYLGQCTRLPLQPPTTLAIGERFFGLTEGDTEAKGVGCAEEIMDLGGYVQACIHGSLHVQISCLGSETHPEPHLRDQHEIGGGPAAEDGGGGWRDRGAPGIRPPSPQGNMEPD